MGFEERLEESRGFHVGTAAEVAWINKKTPGGYEITSAIPPVFEAYATLELPDSGHHSVPAGGRTEEQMEQVWEQHETGLLEVLRLHSDPQPWWFGYLETGGYKIPFEAVPRVKLYADWNYVVVEAEPEWARKWRPETWKGALPDLIFPLTALGSSRRSGTTTGPASAARALS